MTEIMKQGWSVTDRRQVRFDRAPRKLLPKGFLGIALATIMCRWNAVQVGLTTAWATFSNPRFKNPAAKLSQVQPSIVASMSTQKAWDRGMAVGSS